MARIRFCIAIFANQINDGLIGVQSGPTYHQHPGLLELVQGN